MKGKKVFIRTVTMYCTGRVARVTKSWIILDDAAWIADTGRFTDALLSGKFSEVEPIPDGMRYRVARGSVVDLIELKDAFELPRDQK